MSPEILRIGLLADTHFWLDAKVNRWTQLQTHSHTVCTRLVEDLERHNLDRAIHLGDVTCGGGGYAMPDADFDRTLTWFLGQMGRLSFPVHILPGNHDTKPGRLYHDTERAFGLQPGLGISIPLPVVNMQLELLNAQGHSQRNMERTPDGDPTVGQVSAAELARLARALRAARERRVIVLTHQLLVPLSQNGGFTQGQRIQNFQTVLDLMARHGNVHAVFQAHAHVYDRQIIPLGHRDCAFVVAPPACQRPVSWLQMTLDAQGMTLEEKRVALEDAIPRDPARITETPEQDGGAADPWRVDFP